MAFDRIVLGPVARAVAAQVEGQKPEISPQRKGDIIPGAGSERTAVQQYCRTSLTAPIEDVDTEAALRAETPRAERRQVATGNARPLRYVRRRSAAPLL